MKALAVLIVFSLLMGLGTAQEVIVSQNVKLGDYIRQYALVEYSDNGAVYTVPCSDCSSYISLSDADGVNYLYNQSMVKLENGLYGYRSGSLTYGKLYTARFEAVSPTYGSSVMFGEVQISDKSEWVGAVNIDSVSASVASPGDFNVDSCSDLSFVLRLACETKGDQERLENYEFLGSKLGVLGKVLFVSYSALYAFYLVVTIVLGGFFDILGALVEFAVAGVEFVRDVLVDSRRDAAISRLMAFLLMVIMSVLKPFIPFFVVGELFIIAKVLSVKDPGKMMSDFFRGNLEIIMGVLNAVSKALNIVFGFVGGIIAK